MDIRTKIGQRIRELRETKSISQKDLAYASELDRSYIVSVENGQRNISIVNIEKITKALQIPLSDFFDNKLFSEE